MMFSSILFLIGANVVIGYIVYALHQRVEKISKNQAVMVEWCSTLRENEEQLLKDLTRLQHEILNGTKKKSGH